MSEHAALTREALQEHGHLTAADIADIVGIGLSSAYVALREIGARRVRLSKNSFAWALPEDRAEVENPGVIDGQPWYVAARAALREIAAAKMKRSFTAEQYADGFEAMGKRLLELAAHARAVQHSPEWRLTLGIDTAESETHEQAERILRADPA